MAEDATPGTSKRDAPEPSDIDVDADDYQEYVPVAKRRQMEEQRLLARIGRSAATKEAPSTSAADQADTAAMPPPPNKPTYNRTGASLLQKMAASDAPVETENEKLIREELELMRQLSKKQALQAVGDIAKGKTYEKPLDTGWTPPSAIAALPQETVDTVREELRMFVEGEGVPPPITTFPEMRLPRALCEHFLKKGITKPTPIQSQGLPVALSGRDMIGVAYTGSGKTLSFAVPMLMAALQEESRMPLQPGEGPVGMVICPSRELARQTHEVVTGMTGALAAAGYPQLSCMLCIGGVDMRTLFGAVRGGLHMINATPGRLKDLLSKRKINMDICRYLVLDEADRMVDLGFEEDIREVMSYFKSQRQTLMYSATMPDKIRSFAASALVNAALVNVGRAGAANMDVVQEVEYVKLEAKLPYLLDCLQKTGPPVLVFSENKKDVDLIHEYLLVKGVEAVALHGGKDQKDREHAIDSFKEGRADVLVASDVAGKGLDFPHVEHVINYDLPEEIENYVHRIGRTGRAGKTGVATTFINRECSESILLDLKHLLKEAKQRMPPVLLTLEDPMDKYEALEAAAGATKGCLYCGGLGHRVAACPKLRTDNKSQESAMRDKYGGGNTEGLGAEM